MYYYVSYTAVGGNIMYEQPQVPLLRRVLWIVLWLIVIAAVIWVLVWLIFFRQSNSGTLKPATKQSQQSQAVQKSPSTSNPRTATNSTKDNTPTSSSSTPSTNASQSGQSSPAPRATGSSSSSQLANTGPGDVILPAMVATILGGVSYHAWQRRKVSA